LDLRVHSENTKRGLRNGIVIKFEWPNSPLLELRDAIRIEVLIGTLFYRALGVIFHLGNSLAVLIDRQARLVCFGPNSKGFFSARI
jgi:hypothetical protein